MVGTNKNWQLPLCGSCRFLFAVCDSVPSKQEGDAPKSGEGHNGINKAAEEGTRTAEQPCDQIKTEDSYKSPVQTTYDRQYQCNAIHYKTSISYTDRDRMCMFCNFIRIEIAKSFEIRYNNSIVKEGRYCV